MAVPAGTLVLSEAAIWVKKIKVSKANVAPAACDADTNSRGITALGCNLLKML